jgi:hypothetical protein
MLQSTPRARGALPPDQTLRDPVTCSLNPVGPMTVPRKAASGGERVIFRRAAHVWPSRDIHRRNDDCGQAGKRTLDPYHSTRTGMKVTSTLETLNCDVGVKLAHG